MNVTLTDAECDAIMSIAAKIAPPGGLPPSVPDFWPTGGFTLNQADPLGFPAVLMVLSPNLFQGWLDVVSGQYAVPDREHDSGAVLPAWVTPDATWRWGAAQVADSDPGGKPAGTMVLPLTHPMFRTMPAKGWAYAVLCQPDNTDSGLSRMMDNDTSDTTCVYLNHKAGCFSVTSHTAANGVNLDEFPFPKAPIPWTLVVRSIEPGNAQVWANIDPMTVDPIEHMALQARRTDVSLPHSWTAASRVFLNGTGPGGGTMMMAQAKSAYYAIWPHPLTGDDANRLFADPYCMRL